MRAAVVAAALLAVGGLPLAHGLTKPTFGATTTITSEGPRLIVLDLPEAAVLESVALDTPGEAAALYLIGGSNFAQFKLGDEWVPPYLSGLDRELPPARYFLYLWSEPGAVLTTTLTLDGPAGEVRYMALERATIRFASLQEETPVPSATGDLVERYRLHHSGERPAIIGLVRFEEIAGPLEAGSSAYRWQSPEGTFFCWGSPEAGAGPTLAWMTTTWEWFILPDAPAGDVAFEYVEAALERETDKRLYGLAIERAPGDGNPYPWQAWKPFPELPDEAAYDPACVSDAIGLRLHQAVPGTSFSLRALTQGWNPAQSPARS